MLLDVEIGTPRKVLKSYMGKAVWLTKPFGAYLATMFWIDIMLFGQHKDLRASLLVRVLPKVWWPGWQPRHSEGCPPQKPRVTNSNTMRHAHQARGRPLSGIDTIRWQPKIRCPSRCPGRLYAMEFMSYPVSLSQIYCLVHIWNKIPKYYEIIRKSNQYQY